MRRPAVAILLALALGACGDDDTVVSEPSQGDTRAIVNLTVEVRDREQAPPRTATISCTEGKADATGFLAESGKPKPACEAVLDEDNRRLLVEGRPADLACTEIYGGPEEAHITGTIENEPVDTTVNRADGCGIADWDNLAPLLGAPAGGTDPAATTTGY